MRNVFKLLAISSLLIPTMAATDNQANALNFSSNDNLPDVNLGFGVYDFHSAINVISNDTEQVTDEDKAKFVGEVKGLTPFDIKRQKTQLIQQYNDGLKKAKDYFNVKSFIFTNSDLDSGYSLNDFESSYDFEQQQLVIPFKICENNVELRRFLTVKKKESCNNAYIAMPEDKAEKIYNYLKKRYARLMVNIIVANQHKIESCENAYRQACLQGELEKLSVKLVTDDKHKKILFEGDVEFK